VTAAVLASRRMRDDPLTLIERCCAQGRAAVLEEIARLVRELGDPGVDLYGHMLDYPLRPAKALRPTLCMNAARALGAAEEAVLTSAATLELLHNAFLIHDDIEDESQLRRGRPTLQRALGLSVAVNVADGMFALGLRSLLLNTETIGLGPALDVLLVVGEMLQRTVEGQDVELGWIRENVVRFPDGAYQQRYERTVELKTAIYSFVTPLEVAAVAAGAPARVRGRLADYGRHVGIAFQITDDLLNLGADEALYGKEADGDLWEGKRTLILLHALQHEGDPAVLERARRVLALPRPPEPDAAPGSAALTDLLRELRAGGHVDALAEARLSAAIAAHPQGHAVKTHDDVAFLRALVRRSGSAEHARAVALAHGRRAAEAIDDLRGALAPGEASEFLRALPQHVVERLR
jgi:geranylgeranyl diphosphate synthase, type II